MSIVQRLLRISVFVFLVVRSLAANAAIFNYEHGTHFTHSPNAPNPTHYDFVILEPAEILLTNYGKHTSILFGTNGRPDVNGGTLYHAIDNGFTYAWWVVRLGVIPNVEYGGFFTVSVIRRVCFGTLGCSELPFDSDIQDLADVKFGPIVP